MKRKKKKSKNKHLGSNIFGFRRHTFTTVRSLYHRVLNHINIYEQKYMKTILIQNKKDYARWKLTIKLFNNLNEYGNTFILLRNMNRSPNLLR